MNKINYYSLKINNYDAVLKKQKKNVLNKLWKIKNKQGLDVAIEKVKTLQNKILCDEAVKYLFNEIILEELFEVTVATNIISIMKDEDEKEQLKLKLVNILSERFRFEEVEELYNQVYISSPFRIALAKNYTAINYLQADEIDKAVISLIQSVKNIDSINNNQEMKGYISMEVNKTINKLNNVKPEKRNNMLIKSF